MSNDKPLVLTERQLACVTLAARGLSNREIADQVGISERTVKAHIEAVRHKLGGIKRREIPYELLERGINVYPS